MLEAIRVLSIVSTIPALLIWLLRFKTFPKQHNIIGSFLLMCLAFDIALSNTSSYAPILSNIQDALQFFILTLFYWEILFRRRVRKISVWLMVLYGISLIGSIYWLGLGAYHNYSWTIGSAIIATYSILYIAIIPSMVIDRFLDKHLYSNVIISSSLSFYFLTTIFLTFLVDFVFTTLTVHESKLFWSLHNVANIIRNLGLAIGLYFSGKRKTYITLEQLEKMGKEEIRV